MSAVVANNIVSESVFQMKENQCMNFKWYVVLSYFVLLPSGGHPTLFSYGQCSAWHVQLCHHNR